MMSLRRMALSTHITNQIRTALRARSNNRTDRDTLSVKPFASSFIIVLFSFSPFHFTLSFRPRRSRDIYIYNAYKHAALSKVFMMHIGLQRHGHV